MSSIEPLRASALYRRLADANPGVEVWPDENFTEGGWSYAWIVSRFGEGSVRNLQYVRFAADTFSDAPTTRWVKRFGSRLSRA